MNAPLLIGATLIGLGAVCVFVSMAVSSRCGNGWLDEWKGFGWLVAALWLLTVALPFAIWGYVDHQRSFESQTKFEVTR